MRVPAKVPKSLSFLLAMTLLVGFAYPALVTGIARLAFPERAGGSLIVIGGKTRGSLLLAQRFDSPGFFQARPSASDYAYVGAGASNLGPTSASLAKSASERKAAWQGAFGLPVPEEMVYASASGLDPDISPEATLAQVDGVARSRNLDEAAKVELTRAIRDRMTASKSLIGPPRVNVVALNALLETDPRFSARSP
jgi:potassium-transporting ATPase KdpC subunit